MAELFNISHASDLSEWTSTTTSTGDLSWASGAGLAGTTGGMSILQDDVNPKYGQKNFTEIRAATAFGVRFYFDPNTLGSTGGNDATMLQVRETSGLLRAAIIFNKQDGQIWHQMYNDAGVATTSAKVTLPTTEVYIEMLMEEASSSVASDAAQTMYIDNVEQTAANITGVDCFDVFSGISRLRLGIPANATTATTGTVYFDEVVARDDATRIGAVVSDSPPVNTVPGTQEFTFDLSESVSGISVADVDVDLDTIRVQTSGGGTSLVTLSGSVTIVAGANSTDDFTIGTGTQAELNTVIGTLATFRAMPLWPISTETHTITITSTDDALLTDVDAIECNWTVPSGQNQQRMLITGTVAQINSALASLQFTPSGGFSGSSQMNMVSLTSDALVDTDIVSISVVESSPVVLPVVQVQSSSTVVATIAIDSSLVPITAAAAQSSEVVVAIIRIPLPGEPRLQIKTRRRVFSVRSVGIFT